MIKPADILALRSRSDLDSLISVNSEGDSERFAVALSREVNSLIGSDLKAAGKMADALRKKSRLFPPRLGARLLAMQARVRHHSGKPKQALKLYDEAIEMARRRCDWLGAAQMRLGLMDVQTYLGNHRQAIKTGRRALAYFRRKKMTVSVARTLTNLGNVYHRLDDNRWALHYYDQAAAIFSDTGGVALAIVRYNQANVFSNMGKMQEAAERYREAALVYRSSGMDLYGARAEYSLGYADFLCDRHTAALTALEDVLDEFDRLGDRRAAAVTRLDLAEINLHLNQYGTAISLGREAAVALRKLGMRYELGKAQFFVAQGLARCGDAAPASRALRRAELAFAAEGNLLWQGMARLERSQSARAAGRLKAAFAQAREARSLFSRSRDERRRADADIVALEIMAESGRHAEAATRALRQLGSDLILDQRRRLNYLLGVCYRALGKTDQALIAFDASARCVERMLEGLYPDELRFFFALDKMPAYLGAASCLIEVGRVSESLDYYERGISAMNHKSPNSTLRREKIPEELLSQRDELRQLLRRLRRPPESGKRVATGLAEARQTEQKVWELERKIRLDVYRRAGRVENGTVHRHSLDLLKRRETLLTYASLENQVGVFVGQAGEVRYRELGIETEALRALIRELHFVMERPALDRGVGSSESDAAIDFYLRRLHDLLLAPALDLIGGERLLVMADGPFQEIPWLSLRDERGIYLKDKREVRLVADPNDLARPRRAMRIRSGSRGQIFAVSSDQLPRVAEEGEAVRGLFDRSKLHSGDEATVEALKSGLAKPGSFLHVATHAARSSENPLFSRLLMSDGPFFPFDLFETGVRAPLVSLSGCQTAAPGLYYGDSFSLARAFYQAGARFVLASLWSVSDRLTMEMMTEFYRRLSDGCDVHEAYRRAVDHIASITDNPAFWSAFALLGI